MDSELLTAAMAAIGSAYGREAAEFSLAQVKSWFGQAAKTVDLSSQINNSQIEELAESILKSDTPNLDTEVTRRNLARWFEIPQEEFASTPSSQLEPEVLIRHIFLEDIFKTWLSEWGYTVDIGEDLEGLENIDFTPDVYGKLDTLHGNFEVCVNFVCDCPPSQYRVLALLETLEAYATDRSEFNWGDIFVLATPFQFGKSTSAAIRLQSKQENYSVIKLEGDDIYELQHARNAQARLLQLMEHVQKAQLLGPQR